MLNNTRLLLGLTLTLIMSESLYAQTLTVNIKNFQFQPVSLSIDQGDTVQWVNQDSSTHTSTSDNALWDSKNLSAASIFTQSFEKPGKFSYHCSIHPGMKATVIVRTAEQTQIKIGKDIITGSPKQLPITLKLAGQNADQVYRGSYLVNAQGACADCHSCPTYAAGHNPYQGQAKQFNASSYLAGGRAFGPFISANITPDDSGKPAGMTLVQFKSLLRTGHDPDVPGNIMQVMPWPIYGMMSDRDLDAIYAYLSALPKATQPMASACP